MKPVDQKIWDEKRGDCMRATIASLFEFEIEAVPHFMLLPKGIWQKVLLSFFRSCGWEYGGVMNYAKDGPNELKKEDSINGYFYASVPSKNFDNTGHAVVMDMNGVIVHDPHPKKQYQNENVLETGALQYWYLTTKIERGK